MSGGIIKSWYFFANIFFLCYPFIVLSKNLIWEFLILSSEEIKIYHSEPVAVHERHEDKTMIQLNNNLPKKRLYPLLKK